jgi:hypothetical protein
MFSKEMIPLILQVLKSWQVIAATIAMILYIFMISYVARSHHGLRPSRSKPKKRKKTSPASHEETTDLESNDNNELGLEEA